MMKTVSDVAAASRIASPRCSFSALKASSGPYALDESPSAPSPTHASSATSESWWNACGSLTSFGAPKTARLSPSSMMRAFLAHF